jgi:POT family proton-dependent oligopeptide transporter
MFLGLVCMSASMLVMVAAAQRENGPSAVALEGGKLPEPLTVTADNHVAVRQDGKVIPAHAGRLTLDPRDHTLHLEGVLPDNEALDLIEATAPEDFRAKVKQLAEDSKRINGQTVMSAEVRLDREPPGFDMAYSGLAPSAVRYRASDHTLVAYETLAERQVKGLLVAGGDPDFRETIRHLYQVSRSHVVSSWWLFWVYILATFGELCLSPVGLSMVSKLAPAKFATMLMGVWMLTSAFGNFAAGTLGEIWGTIPPVQFFLLSAAVLGGAALVLLVLVRFVVRTMHGVN